MNVVFYCLIAILICQIQTSINKFSHDKHVDTSMNSLFMDPGTSSSFPADRRIHRVPKIIGWNNPNEQLLLLQHDACTG